MNFYNLNNTHVLKSSFKDYLQDLTYFYLQEESLLHGLKKCNKNYKDKPFMIVKSNCADKNFLCINKNISKHENIAEEINRILELHVKKIELSKNIIDEYY